MEIDLENLPEQKLRLQNIIALLSSKNKELVQSNTELYNVTRQVKRTNNSHSANRDSLCLLISYAP